MIDNGIINREFMEQGFMITREEDLKLIKKFVIDVLRNYPLGRSIDYRVGWIKDISHQMRTYRFMKEKK